MTACSPWILCLLVSLAQVGPGAHEPFQIKARRGEVEPPAACQQCGMDRTRFSRSRMLLRLPGGGALGTCSLRCAAEALAGQKEAETPALQVADYQHPSRLLEARTATWVVGGKLPGVMTALPKWAFRDEKQAAAFIRRHGGRKAAFAEALELAQQEAAGSN